MAVTRKNEPIGSLDRLRYEAGLSAICVVAGKRTGAIGSIETIEAPILFFHHAGQRSLRLDSMDGKMKHRNLKQGGTRMEFTCGHEGSEI
jgi:hypothetical protein